MKTPKEFLVNHWGKKIYFNELKKHQRDLPKSAKILDVYLLEDYSKHFTIYRTPANKRFAVIHKY